MEDCRSLFGDCRRTYSPTASPARFLSWHLPPSLAQILRMIRDVIIHKIGDSPWFKHGVADESLSAPGELSIATLGSPTASHTKAFTSSLDCDVSP
jgi:hypothetical protein